MKPIKEQKESILIVDDDDGSRRSLSLIFGRRGYRTESASTAGEALNKAKERFFNAVLLDIRLPDMEGVKLIAPLKELHPDMAVIMVTAHASLDNAIRALNEGASAYITKPLDMTQVVVAVRNAIEKQHLILENKKLYDAAQRELADRRRAEEQLAHIATHDQLTGLPNRTLFRDRSSMELAHASRNRKMVATLLLDLDRFKEINDTLGHGVGDRLLQAVAKRLSRLLRKSDTIARMGGDEFTILLPELAHEEDAEKIAEKILEAFREPFSCDGRELRITTSIGISVFPCDGGDTDALVKNADIAMYRAKREGRDNFKRYSADEKPKGER